MKREEVEEEYRRRYSRLVDCAETMQALLRSTLKSRPRIDIVSARAKSPERFLAKACQRLCDGQPRYTDPLNDIQDQIGARAVVYYKEDVEATTSLIVEAFPEIENTVVSEQMPSSFGYEARHCVCVMPEYIRLQHDVPVCFFELQVCTLFQHAWAQANHDLGYKPKGELDPADRRRLAWAAAQAWGADEIFSDLFSRRRHHGVN